MRFACNQCSLILNMTRLVTDIFFTVSLFDIFLFPCRMRTSCMQTQRKRWNSVMSWRNCLLLPLHSALSFLHLSMTITWLAVLCASSLFPGLLHSLSVTFCNMQISWVEPGNKAMCLMSIYFVDITSYPF